MVLVSFLGDFDSNILPLFFHYSEEIRLHVLVTDKRHSEQQHAKRIQVGLQRFCTHLDIAVKLQSMGYDEDSAENIHMLFDRISNLLQPDEKLLLNSTDALASTQAIMQSKLFALQGELLAYDRFDNTCNILSADGTMQKKVISPMTINQHLMLKDLQFDQLVNETELLPRKDVVTKLMQNSRRYNAFKNAYVKNQPLDSYVDIIASLKGIDQYNGTYIQGALFEEYCYWLVQGLGFDDVQLGTVVFYEKENTTTYKNELDILCIKDNHLNIIECKFRNRVKGEELIFKYDSIIDLLDQDGKVMIVAIGGENNQGYKGIQFNQGTKDRAKSNNIYIFQDKVMDPQKFRYQVQSFFITSTKTK